MIEQHNAIHAQAQQQGAYVGAAELRPPQTAKSVRLQQGKALINDGPFVEQSLPLPDAYWNLSPTSTSHRLAVEQFKSWLRRQSRSSSAS